MREERREERGERREKERNIVEGHSLRTADIMERTCSRLRFFVRN